MYGPTQTAYCSPSSAYHQCYVHTPVYLLLSSLTTEVAEEALSTPTCCIISYHPTIFKPVSSLTLAQPRQRSLLRCAAAGISVYCPHTSLDSVHDGINDWLAEVCTVSASETQKIPASVALIGESIDDLGGSGRVVTYEDAISMSALIGIVKQGLNLEHSEEFHAFPEHAICADVQT